MKKKWLIGGCAALVLVLIAGIGIATGNKKSNEESTVLVSSSIEENMDDQTSISASSEEDEEEDKGKDSDSKKKKTESDSAEHSSDTGSSEGSSGSASKNDSKKENTKPEKVITLPYTCSGSSLVLENLSSYDGEFIEDGSDTPISNCAIAILHNTGSTCLEFGTVQIVQGNKTLEFEFSAVGAGEKVAVLEKDGQKYSDAALNSASAILAEVNAFEMSESQVTIEEMEGGDLLVSNISNADIPCVRIFYKFYMPDQKAYVGGITYNSKITDLKAGDSIVVTPSHYKDGSSKVVMVRTYATAD